MGKVHAAGDCALHAPLVTGSWQVRVYELGVAKSTSSTWGDMVTAVTSNDPAKPTTFTLDLGYYLPKQQKSGTFTASIMGVDQAKADYFCIEIPYKLTGVHANNGQNLMV